MPDESNSAFARSKQEYRFALFAGFAVIPAFCGGPEIAIAMFLGILIFDVLVCRGYVRAIGMPVRSATFAGLLARLIGVQVVTIAIIFVVAMTLLSSIFSW